MSKLINFSKPAFLSLLFFAFVSNAFAGEQLWHKVRKDGIVYDILIDSDILLNGRALYYTDFISNINSIKVLEQDTSKAVIDATLLRDILVAAQGTALFKQNNPFMSLLHKQLLF